MEDPRVTRVDELDCWVIAYTAFGPQGPAVALATTRDFVTVERLGCGVPAGGQGRRPAAPPGRWRFHSVPPAGVGDRRPTRGVVVPVPRSSRLGRPGTGVRCPPRGLVGLGPGRHRPTADGNPRGVAGDLSRCPGHRGRRPVPGRPGAAGPGEPRRGARPVRGMGARPDRTVRADRAGPRRRVSLRADPHARTGELRLYYGAANTCIAMATARLDDVIAYLLATRTENVSAVGPTRPQDGWDGTFRTPTPASSPRP